jgi:hypothetical protein
MDKEIEKAITNNNRMPLPEQIEKIITNVAGNEYTQRYAEVDEIGSRYSDLVEAGFQAGYDAGMKSEQKRIIKYLTTNGAVYFLNDESSPDKELWAIPMEKWQALIGEDNG